MSGQAAVRHDRLAFETLKLSVSGFCNSIYLPFSPDDPRTKPPVLTSLELIGHVVANVPIWLKSTLTVGNDRVPLSCHIRQNNSKGRRFIGLGLDRPHILWHRHSGQLHRLPISLPISSLVE